jgi:serine/threonine-protein kinase
MATVHYGRLLGPVGFSRTVAIKRLHPQFAQDPEFVTMFLDEARLAGRIRHPNVVATLDVVATSNEIFLVMDYVHGESLARILKEVTARGQLIPLPIALRIATDALQGLHAAHEARDERGLPLNIVHRDISPQNILVGVDGTARLVDFGVAKASGQGQTTREGQIKGKLGYMAPEQLRAGRVTRQTDVHAFATVLWEMIAGRRLFLGETEADTIARVVQHVVPALSDIIPGLSPQVDLVLKKGLAEALDVRYASARDMCIALGELGPTASTMQVADWVQAQVHDLIERRAEVVSAIENNQEHSGPAENVKPEAEASSAQKFVKRLSEPDLGEAPKEARAGVVSLPSPTADQGPVTSISTVMDGVLRPRRAKPWGQIAAGTLGVLGLGFGLFAWTHSGGDARPSAKAAAPPATSSAPPLTPPRVVPAVDAAAVAPVAASVTPPVAVPSATALPPAPAAAPPPPRPAAPVVRPPPPAAPPATNRPPAKHDNVFDSRE